MNEHEFSLIAWINSAEGVAVLLSALATLGAVILAQWLRGGVKLIWFSPNSTNFRIATPDTANPFIFINSGQIFVQNEGRRSATDVQVTSMPGMPPAGYSIVPSIVHSVENGPQGEWILKIPYLGREPINGIPRAALI